MTAAPQDLAEELKKIARFKGQWETLVGQLPVLSGFFLVTRLGGLDALGRVVFILNRLIPDYLARLPASRDCLAIRDLLTCEDKEGWPDLTTRYHRMAFHLVCPPVDMGRRIEPRLRLECARRFIVLDQQDRLAGRPPEPPVNDGIDTGGRPAEQLAAGIVQLHQHLDYHLLRDYIARGEKITILNTWIPGLDILADGLIAALTRGAYVSILMLYPDGEIAQLRTQALHGPRQPVFNEIRVQPRVRDNLRVLAEIAAAVGDDCRRHLRVKLYDSLPSISVYSVDDRALVGVFLHGRLAVNSVQIEVERGQDGLMGQLVFDELAMMWEIAQPVVDLDQWRMELENMRLRSRTQP